MDRQPHAPAARRGTGDSVLFLARSLGVGGAERQLAVLARGLRARGHRVVVACFYSGGPIEADLAESGVDVVDLGKRGRWDIGRFMQRLVNVVRQERPDVIHGYLPVPNILTAAIRPWAGQARIVWGVRASDMDFARYDRLERFTFGLSRRMATRADLIIANSWAGLRHHVACGYPDDRICVIPNGIDTDRFQPDSAARARLRREWGFADDDPVVGIIARLDPMKGHEVFLNAVAALRRTVPNVRAVCIGGGPAEYLDHLQRLAGKLGVADTVRWVGVTHDAPAAYNAIDVLCSSSIFGEGFSNAVAEALSCGTPCVVSDVGDAREIVGTLGTVVPRNDPAALAEALSFRLSARSPTHSAACRRRIVENFSVERLVDRSEAQLFAAP